MMFSRRKREGKNFLFKLYRPYSSVAFSFLRSNAVGRVVLDEAHSVFLSESYRPKMQSLVHLRESPVQKILLTATLTPLHEKVLADRVGISLSGALVLRSPTARLNHRFQIARVSKPQTPLIAGVQLASLLLDSWNEDPDIRGIMFFRTVKKLHEFSDSCPFAFRTFHGKLTDSQKEQELKSWLSRESSAKWILSTTALLHGVDYHLVNAVVFIECPYGLYDFVQGAGRAGRNGQESLIAVLHSGIPPPLPEESQYGCRLEMEKVVADKACRRLGISAVMDDEKSSCSTLVNALPCDFCQGHLYPLVAEAIKHHQPLPVSSNPLSTTPATPIRKDSDKSLSRSSKRFPPSPSATAVFDGLTVQAEEIPRIKHARSVKDLMERYAGCFTCRIKDEDHRPCHQTCETSGVSGCSVRPHNIYTCTDFPHKRGWIDWKRRYFRWPRDLRRCYFCGLPNLVAGQHMRSNSRDGSYPGMCKFSDSALSAAWHVLNTPHLFERLQVDLGFAPRADPKVEFALWVTDYESDLQDIRLLSVFSWLCDKFYSSG